MSVNTLDHLVLRDGMLLRKREEVDKDGVKVGVRAPFSP
jgi:hypothetical protein